MTDNKDKVVTLSLDGYLEIEGKAFAFDSIVESHKILAKKYEQAIRDLELLAPTVSGVALQTADGLLCYMPGPIEQHLFEVRRPIKPTALRPYKATDGLPKDDPEYRRYGITSKTTVHGLRIYEEVLE